MREAALALAVLLAPTLASAQHACENGEHRSEECAAACADNPPDQACAQVCLDYAGVDWCRGYCAAHPDRSCRPVYTNEMPECLDFQGAMLRLSLRAVGTFQARDAIGGSLGGQLAIGVRVSPEWSVVAKLRGAPIGVDGNLDWILSAGGELGVEWMLHDFLQTQTALAMSLSGGVWLPNYCRANAPCPFAAPIASLQLDHVWFGESPNHYYRGFQGLSVGLEGAVGYDPWIAEWLGRVSLTFGAELAFH